MKNLPNRLTFYTNQSIYLIKPYLCTSHGISFIDFNLVACDLLKFYKGLQPGQSTTVM